MADGRSQAPSTLESVTGEMLQNMMDDMRRAMDRERQQSDKRIKELESQRDEYKRERDEWKRRCEEAEAKAAADDEAHSRVARTIVHDGSLYHGTIRKVGGTEVPHGTGLLRSLDGEEKLYEGEWKDGKYHGKGKEYAPCQVLNQERQYETKICLVYEGDFAGGKREGQKGTEYQAMNGFMVKAYEGGWVDGEKKGTGVAVYMQWKQNYYQGPTRDGKPHRQGGRELRHDGQPVYEGEWSDGKYHGKGKEYAPSQVVNKRRQYETKMCLVYEGDFVDGKRQGV